MKQKILAKMAICIVLITSFSMASCRDDKDEAINPPKIIIEQEDATFTTKVGKAITISPSYENAEDAVFAWVIDGKIVSKERAFTYESDEVGSIFVTLEVVNNAGSTFAEMKINIATLLTPSISMAVPEQGYKVIVDGELKLIPEVEEYNMPTSYRWYVDNKEVSSGKEYVFSSSLKGSNSLKLVVENEDGKDEFEFPVQVCTADELPFKWFFEQTEFNLSTGRSIRIKIWDIENSFDAIYTWSVNGKVVQEGKDTQFVFGEKAIGKYTLLVTMKNDYTSLSQQLIVNVCEAEGAHKRPASANSKVAWNKVYEFLPAPGQFINEGYTANNMDEAIAYAESRLAEEQFACLGGFGGYLVVGFDHSIENDGSYNIQIKGNSFAGSSEPGIVWVMQDENGDGWPNDTWYELKGSEYGKSTTIADYAVTYYKPKAPGLPVQWTDNQGKIGSIDYLGGFHKQDYYYPAWVKTDTYTLRGTCLPASNRETSPGYWYNGEFEWGYVDNFSIIDRLTDDINFGAAANGNHFKISDAVTHDGKPADLKYIDFIKVQTGVNCKSGWLGEVSCEVFTFNDFNILKKKSTK